MTDDLPSSEPVAEIRTPQLVNPSHCARAVASSFGLHRILTGSTILADRSDRPVPMSVFAVPGSVLLRLPIAAVAGTLGQVRQDSNLV